MLDNCTLVYTTDANVSLCSQEDSVHDSLAVDVANTVMSEPDNSLLTHVYCHAVNI